MTSLIPTEHRLRSDTEIAASIRCILSDVDGVLSNGQILYSQQGNQSSIETKQFHVRDGLGIKLWMRSGCAFGIITARDSPIVSRRCEDLGIEHLKQGSQDKWETAQQMMSAMNVSTNEIAYIGDDLPDLNVMQRVALAVAPADAAYDVREASHWTLQCRGGQGVVRELIERLMRAKGTWNEMLGSFKGA